MLQRKAWNKGLKGIHRGYKMINYFGRENLTLLPMGYHIKLHAAVKRGEVKLPII